MSRVKSILYVCVVAGVIAMVAIGLSRLDGQPVQIAEQRGAVVLVAELDDVAVYEVRRIVGVPCYLAVAQPRSETSGGPASVSLACP